MNRTLRITLLTVALVGGVAACGSDSADNKPSSTTPPTAAMTESTDAMTLTTDAMTESTDAMTVTTDAMTESTDAMTATTGG